MDASAWDARYAASDLVWSATPNIWVAQLCAPMSPGRALDIAAGEGRNAIWLAEQGWQVDATDYSQVAIERLGRIAAERLGPDAVRVAGSVADATQPAPGTAYDLALFCYVHLPPEQWRAALEQAVAATRPGGAVLVIAHSLRNLTEGVGGPQVPEILQDPEHVVASAHALPVVAELAELRRREVPAEVGHRHTDGHAHQPTPGGIALDTVVLLRKTAG